MLATGSRIGYAPINGLYMYYEVHGQGRPLVLLHGGLMTIDGFGSLLPTLAQSRQVIAVELQGHGRTADLDRPLHPAQLAEDVAGLLEHLKIERADLFGFSLGGVTALRIASRYPELVRRLVVVSAPYSNDGYYPSIVASWPSMTAELLDGTPMERDYRLTAPDPDHWPVLVDKVRHGLMDFEGWSTEEMRSIDAPALLVLGDADVVRPEYAVEMFRLFSAREDGGMAGLPESQLAILPGTTHFSILESTELLPVVVPFLDFGMPDD